MKSALSLALLGALASGAFAQTLISSNFDAPTYTANVSVVGQDGWLAGSNGGATRTVSTAGAVSGSQSLFFINVGSSINYYSVRKPFTPISGASYTATTKIRLNGSTGADRHYGMYLSTGLLGGTYFGATIAGDGSIRAGKDWPATFSNPAAGVLTDGTFENRWLDLTLSIDAAGNGNVLVSGLSNGATYSYDFTGVTLGTTTNYLNLGSDFSGFNASTGVGAFDDVSLVATPVPEPASVAVLGLGAAALIRRRRKA